MHVRLDSTKNQLKGFGKQGKPSAEDRARFNRRKAEQNLKVVCPGSVVWQLVASASQASQSQAELGQSQASSSQGVPAKGDRQHTGGLRVVGGRIQWGMDDLEEAEDETEEIARPELSFKDWAAGRNEGRAT